MLTIKYFFAVITVWLTTSTFLYNMTGKSECFWFILFNISALSIFGIFLYACLGIIGNRLIKKEVSETLKDEISLNTKANTH